MLVACRAGVLGRVRRPPFWMRRELGLVEEGRVSNTFPLREIHPGLRPFLPRDSPPYVQTPILAEGSSVPFWRVSLSLPLIPD